MMTSSQRSRPVVAIDGPAGAGKSTVTRLVANRLGYTRVDTGALYRTVALLTQERGASWQDQQAVVAAARRLAEPGVLHMSTAGDSARIVVDGRDVSQAIRSQDIGTGASQVSQLSDVRSALLDVQRNLGKDGGVVLEGRDIGSVVFPDAEAKFYLTASTEIRAERRRAELGQRGDPPPLQEVIQEVAERDRRDTSRPVSPLIKAPDAIEVDSSSLSLEQVVDRIVAQVEAIAAQQND